jgi:nitrous oxidase accessory protein
MPLFLIVLAAPAAASPLQARIDAAAPGDVIVIDAGRYPGDIVIDKRVTLRGVGRPLLIGSGRGSVVRVRAADVVIEGFDVDGGGGGDLGEDPAGIHVAAPRAVIRDCRIRNALFGIYLHAADDVLVERCRVEGIPGRAPGEIGSGIHAWNTQRFRLHANDIRRTRDGFYIQSSSDGRVIGNTARDLRYGLHYMYSDDNIFEDNTFENGAAGAALMYSRRLAFRRNRFLHNRGFASVGLLLKACDDVIAEDNLIADNARGIFIEGSYRNVFRRNIIARSDTAVVLYDSSGGNVLEANAFIGNMTPLTLVGRRTDTRFDGNFWSGNREPDLDGDGRSDRPYRLSSLFDHVRGNLAAADLYADGLAAAALAAAEATFPVLEPVEVVDRTPLAEAPPLSGVPRVRSTETDGIAHWPMPMAMVALGAAVLWPRGGRRKDGRS